jgi:iron(III) transport system substrate-binding protein
MRMARFSRRDLLKASSGLAALAFATPARAAAPPPTPITPALIEAARKEGKVVFYTAMEITTAERMAKAFEAKYPGIAVKVERTGSERLFQRIGQEMSSRIYAVDVIDSADASHFISWKQKGWLEPFVPEDVARHYPADHRDPDGMFATGRALLSVIAYNTNLVKRDDAPKSFADLLDPKWAGKIVKGHPGYSGTIMTATFQTVRELGWEFYEKLAKQRVMQVQSATDPPKKIALGERAIMADGSDYLVLLAKERGEPVEVVYAAEGSPLITCPNGVFKSAPNPNAARLFNDFFLSLPGQTIISDYAQRSMHALVKEKPGRVPFSAVKVWKDDPAGVERAADEIKARYAKLFRV